MKHFVFLILVAFATIAVLLFIFNPQMLADIWLWIVGLVGPIVAAIRNGIESISNLGRKSEGKATESTRAPKPELSAPDSESNARRSQSEKRIKELEAQIADLQLKIQTQNRGDRFDGTTITVLRYFDDTETTLGLLFLEDRFYCYTLEDTFRKVKVAGQTRIPHGTYNLDFYQVLTPLTKKYRATRPWFDYHLHVQKVESFSNVYIHSGSDHTHTEGCLLIADGIYSSDKKRTIFNSRETYKRFYGEIKKLKAEERKVRLKILDEDWFECNELKNSYLAAP